MPDIFYDFTEAPRNPYSLAARMAVLPPLLGRRIDYANSDAVLRGGLQVHMDYKNLLVGLQGAGWPAVNTNLKLQCLRNCPPSGFVIEPDADVHVCHHPELCPWCYCRSIKSTFAALTEHITVKSRAVWMVGRQNWPWEKLTPAFVERRREWLATLVQANKHNYLGATWMLTFEPLIRDEVKKVRVSNRIIAILKSGRRFEYTPRQWRGRTLTKLNKAKLVNVICRTLRYPEFLFRGEPADVATILRCRSGIRLAESYGCLRGTKSAQAKRHTKADEEAGPDPTSDGT